MKRGAKMTVFFASMVLTVSSLVAFVGPRHFGNGMYGHGGWASHQHDSVDCTPLNSAGPNSTTAK